MRRNPVVRGVAHLAVLLAWLLIYSPLVFADEQTSSSHDGESEADSTDRPAEWELIDRISSIDSMRVVMHARESDARLADQLQSLLAALGVDDVQLRYVEQVPDAIQVRVFHGADGQAGDVVADVLALVFDDVSTRSLENYQPSPAEGLVEIWLP